MTALNASRILTMLNILSFRQAVWLFPVATALYFLEEAPRFAQWTRAYASPLYTESRWRKIHAVGMAYATAFTAVVALFPNRYTTFLFFALSLTEAFFNTLFHLGATLLFRSYCPGLMTALAFYPVLFWYLGGLAYREGLLSLGAGVAALLIAGVIHAFDVATTVFFMKVPWASRRASCGP